MNRELENDLNVLVKRYGKERVLRELERSLWNMSKPDTCTILINEGLHNFPNHLFVGEKYVFYRGSIDLSSEKNLESMLRERIDELKSFLRKRKWKQIFIVVSGHAAVCMQVKLAVYRVTHIETVDWVFDGAGNYLRLELPLRELLSDR